AAFTSSEIMWIDRVTTSRTCLGISKAGDTVVDQPRDDREHHEEESRFRSAVSHGSRDESESGMLLSAISHQPSVWLTAHSTLLACLLYCGSETLYRLRNRCRFRRLEPELYFVLGEKVFRHRLLGRFLGLDLLDALRGHVARH